jgi:hypothetical protein
MIIPMSRTQPVEQGRWLALVASLPAEDPVSRMSMLRTLESLGAAVMREGVYLLPDTPASRNGLEHLAEYVGKVSGSAQVLQVLPVSEAQQSAFRGLFDRSERYAALIKIVESMKVGFGIADPGAISRVLNKQRREFDAICALDFFPSEVQERAKAALGSAEAAVHKLQFPAQAQNGDKPDEPLQRRVWATRSPPWADRLACGWLIRRFVDPEGSVLWLDKAQACPPTAVGFAFEGARFGNNASQVTFQVMLQRFGLAQNAALAKIGAIVHFLEAREATVPEPEAAGVQTLLQGGARRSANDDEWLTEAEKTFDLLYDAYFEPTRK